MAENNKSYRIRTKVGREADTFLNVHLEQDYDSLEILSLKISDKDTYKLHNSDYGVIVGRVLANGNFGVPNAKISVFIPSTEQNSSMEMWNLYPYTTTSTKNDDNIRYNLLPDESVKDCHKAVGTFPNKTFLLDNDATIEVFDKYYVYTTRTNAAGDYLICGVPTGMQTLHMDLDLSDCGILSQRPRDFVYKGYTIEQFENPNQFKKDENIDGLSQIFSQNHPVYVQPFWGNSDNGEEIGITRADIEIAFKFEPTCVFMGSAISDNASNGVGKKCVPTNQMGAMEELTAGEGTIEMIRKTPAGNVEEFSIKGNQLIDGNGVWCYQIPMNLDYMMTDEYGNMVPTDDPEKGIPTRTRVRFRASLTDMENSSQSYFRAKYLIPNNPNIDDSEPDYNFGTYTDESSYRDLFWNCVYTVKSYIPRFQKSKRWNNERFSGIKACNYYGGNNPIPYNNLRIKLPFMFTVLCIFVKAFIKIITIVNRIMFIIFKAFYVNPLISLSNFVVDSGAHCLYIGDGLCPDMEGWYFAPACMVGLVDEPFISTEKRNWYDITKLVFKNTIKAATTRDNSEGGYVRSSQYTDETSIDSQNITDTEKESVCLTSNVDYLLNCFEMNLAQEYRVIKFDFYNDWLNGVIYFPRWMRKIKRKKRYRFSLTGGISTYYKDKVQGCMNSANSTVKKTRYYTQQCSLAYTGKTNEPWTTVKTPISCNPDEKSHASMCHKKRGMDQSSIFGVKSGLVTEQSTMLGEYVYYLKPCEWKDTDHGRVRTILFATDIVLLGTLNDCDENGLPQSFKYLSNTSYVMPTNLALTTMDDDPYIYADSGGTVCFSTGEQKDFMQTGPSFTVPKDSATRITPNYSSTSSAYSVTENDKLEYAENDDPIAVTESAGIMWNYSGPGQDDVLAGSAETPGNLVNRLYNDDNNRYNYLYYPGGHFLGLSCVNSETNIKSCVNLKRICELGATMSQRREEIRGYDKEKGIPQYRYYVPTGLISNVDIEGASFRSMFATLNQNKLIATKTNENTGYEFYNLRFLRPDGFDGSLMKYVHKDGSPYNRKVNHDDIIAASDDSAWFKEAFPLSWQTPLDYDPNETAFTETRTIEDTVKDYYMFRFGLKDFSAKEQKKRYLLSANNGYSMPQYENSFYFYFGLKDGATALDEFKKQFFSQCEINAVMKEASLSISENFDENLSGTATLVINNMVEPYDCKISDNTEDPDNKKPFTIVDDTFVLNNAITMIIGHEYTVTVTDSLEQTLTKTFVFGSDVVSADVDFVHFRYDRRNASISKTDPRYGGFVRIGDTVRILDTEYHISDTANPLTFGYKKLYSNGWGGTIRNLYERDSYVDASGDIQHVFTIDNVGTYDIYVYYNGTYAPIFRATFEDNKDVELSVGCDYLSYKTGYGLSGITENQWYNDSVVYGLDTVDSWLFRHTFYRQTQNESEGFNCHLYTKTKNANIAVFGWPEQGGLTSDGSVLENTFNKNDYDEYKGYIIDETWSFIPTMYWSTSEHKMADVTGRNPFDTMVYTPDGRSAADATNIKVTSILTDGANVKIKGNGTPINGIAVGHGCIIVLENEMTLFPVVTGITGQQIDMICYNIENPYVGITDQTQLEKLLSYATLYPTLIVPVIYKPFFGEVSALTWNLTGITIDTADNGAAQIKRVELPMSYKVEGEIHNGLSWNNKFYSGETSDYYETYLIDNESPKFYNDTTIFTSQDYEYDRTFCFGANNSDEGYCREVTVYDEGIKPIDEIIYAISEGRPGNDEVPSGVMTGRYTGEFDTVTLTDSCELFSAFPNNLRVFAYSEDGIDGVCALVADSIPSTSTTELYAVTNDRIFIKDGCQVTNGRVDETHYCYGAYNKNAPYDTNGEQTQVTCRMRLGDNNTYVYYDFKFGRTQSDGTKILLTRQTVQEVYDEGVTLLPKFTLNDVYKKNITGITEGYLNPGRHLSTAFTATTLVNGAPKPGATVFTNLKNECNTIIAKYTRPATSNKNGMVVYRLYPVESLEVIYPIEPIGVPPYINPETQVMISHFAQEVNINVHANVDYRLSTSDAWISVPSEPYDMNAGSVTFSVAANTSEDERTGTVTYTAIDGSAVATSEIIQEGTNPEPYTSLTIVNKMVYDTFGTWETTAQGYNIAGDIHSGQTMEYGWPHRAYPFDITGWMGVITSNALPTWYIVNKTHPGLITLTLNNDHYESTGSFIVYDGDEIWLTDNNQ